MFVREDRYLVIKKSDLAYALARGDVTHTAVAELNELLQGVDYCRRERGKLSLKCVVVEDDWSTYEATWKAIEEEAANRARE